MVPSPPSDSNGKRRGYGYDIVLIKIFPTYASSSRSDLIVYSSKSDGNYYGCQDHNYDNYSYNNSNNYSSWFASACGNVKTNETHKIL